MSVALTAGDVRRALEEMCAATGLSMEEAIERARAVAKSYRNEGGLEALAIIEQQLRHERDEHDWLARLRLGRKLVVIR